MIMYRPATNSLAIEREILNFLQSRGYSKELARVVRSVEFMNASIKLRNGELKSAYEITITVTEIEK